MSFSVGSPVFQTILGSPRATFHPFLTLCGQLTVLKEPRWSPERQSSLVPSLYGQITGLTQPARSPFPCFPRRVSLSLQIQQPCVCTHLSPVHDRSRISVLCLVLGVLLLGAAPLGMGRAGQWDRDPEPMGSLQDGRWHWGHTLCLRGVGDTENRLKYSPQLVPIIPPAASVVSQSTTWGVGARRGCRVKKH